MNAKRFWPAIAIAAGLAGATGGCQASGTGNPFGLDSMVGPAQHDSYHGGPFRARLEGQSTFEVRPAGRCRTMDVPFITLTTGWGQASGLGRVEFSASHCFEMTQVAPPPYGFFERGEWAFVAANGDELYATYEGEQLTPIMDPILGTVQIVFTGGTGRFQNATGTAHGEVTIRVPVNWETDPWPVIMAIEGRIVY